MRDVLILFIVYAGAFLALKRPWIGVMLWTWLSLMNPHRLSWGIAYDAPVAAVTAAATLLGLLFTRERESPFKSGAPVVLAVFMFWMTLSWMNGLGGDDDYYSWNKAMKVDLMILVTLALLRTKQHIFALAWVAAASLAILGVKGGIFTIIHGGNHHVWGPPGTFIEDNNEFGLALVMTIPLLRFLQMQLTNKTGKMALTVVMVVCAAASIGSQSRGALLAISAMALVLWWRGKSRFLGGIVIVGTAVAVLTLMPDAWFDRMSTIKSYEEDGSAMGRISAWWNAWNLAFHYPLGVGFNAARPELFAVYSPYPLSIHAAHSIYFQILGNHGFIGLGIFLLIWLLTWKGAGRLRVDGGREPQTKWVSDLGAMCQVSLVGYFVGGAFLSLAYFDLPYIIMVLVVLSTRWLRNRSWEKEPAYLPSFRWIPGLAPRARVGRTA